MPTSATPQRYIQVKGVKTHNLKNFDIDLPHRKLIVVTGLSGSGKSSFAFDTLYPEGHRRYIESLSAYARQFLGKIEKPPVDSIYGLLPTIGLQQKGRTHNPRARVSTSSDLYPYLKLLYARIGTTYSPHSGKEVKKDTVTDVVNYIQSIPTGTKVYLMAPLHLHTERTPRETLEVELGKGFSRLMWQGQRLFIEDLLAQPTIPALEGAYLLIDRLVTNPTNTEHTSRLADSVQTTFFEGQGICTVEAEGLPPRSFSDRFEMDGITFEEPTSDFFNFNSPHGACKHCTGTGRTIGIAKDKVIPDPSKSIYQGAILPWESFTMQAWKERFISQANAIGFPFRKPYKDLTTEEKRLVWHGTAEIEGILDFFTFLASKPHKVQYRVLHARYRGRTPCRKCRGTGLRPDADHVKISGKSLIDLLTTPVDELYHFFTTLDLPPHQQQISHLLLEEIINKLHYLQKVNLGYLTLNRATKTLSGGEYQRIRLAKACGSPLVDSLYIFDEFTTGLHPKDVANATDALLALLKMGNTIVAVEHEEAVMKLADQIVDIGPQAGEKGGEVVFQGSYKALLTKATRSYTADYLSGKAYIPLPEKRRTWKEAITLTGITEHNLQNVTAQFPLGALTAITGVSGSGKSTLVGKVLYPTIASQLALPHLNHSSYETLSGPIEKLHAIEYIDQNSLGKSTRSNPATYLKAYDAIRKTLASQPLAVQRGYTPSTFSFNVPGGRCETCLGDGSLTVEMQFMGDVHLTCEDCSGQRFKQEVLEVVYKGKNISEVLNLTTSEALQFFADDPTIVSKLKPLLEVGLGYLRLGQPSGTFSGGEAQRLKIASYLNKERSAASTMFIFDEPTTGLHFHDVHRLMDSLQQLIERGHTVLVIEHNTDVIKLADWIIDLGPDGGEKGGHVVFTGTPEEMIQLKNNHTAKYLREKVYQTRAFHQKEQAAS